MRYRGRKEERKVRRKNEKGKAKKKKEEKRKTWKIRALWKKTKEISKDGS